MVDFIPLFTLPLQSLVHNWRKKGNRTLDLFFSPPRISQIAPTFSDNGFTIGVILQSSGGTYNTIAQAWDQTTKYQFGIGTDANTSTLSMSFSNPVSGGSNNRCSINCVDENGDALNLDDRTNFIVASWSASGGFKCRINGVDQTIVLGSYSAASAHVSHFSIGDSKEQWAKWAGWIGELIWYENQLSDDDVKIVEKYGMSLVNNMIKMYKGKILNVNIYIRYGETSKQIKNIENLLITKKSA